MAHDFAKSFYHSSAWLKNRRNYLTSPVNTSGEVCVMRDDGWHRRSDDAWVPSSSVVPPGMCERCFVKGELNAADIVHHIRHLTPQNIDDASVTLGFSNFMRVCRDCHAYLHGSREEPRVTFNDDGTIVPREESLREMVMRLTETVDDRRNIHRGERHG